MVTFTSLCFVLPFVLDVTLGGRTWLDQKSQGLAVEVSTAQQTLQATGHWTVRDAVEYEILTASSALQDSNLLLVAGKIKSDKANRNVQTFGYYFFAAINMAENLRQVSTIRIFKFQIKSEASHGVNLYFIRTYAEDYAVRPIAELPSWKAGTKICELTWGKFTIEQMAKFAKAFTPLTVWIQSTKLTVLVYLTKEVVPRFIFVAFSTVFSSTGKEAACIPIAGEYTDSLARAEDCFWTRYEDVYAFHWVRLEDIYPSETCTEIYSIRTPVIRDLAKWLNESEEVLLRVNIRSLYRKQVFFIGEYKNKNVKPGMAFLVVQEENGTISKVFGESTPTGALKDFYTHYKSSTF